MKTKTRDNVEMCKIYVLRRNNAAKDNRIFELEKMLARCMREIETMQAQLGDSQSDMLLQKCVMVMENKVKEIY